MTLKLIAGPTAEPLTLAEAKTHLRVSHTAEDALIFGFIGAARQACEHLIGRVLITQTWEEVVDAFPESELQLTMPAVQTIVSVKYIDTAGIEQTLDQSLYTLDNVNTPGWLLPAYSTTWPATLDTANAVKVRFTTGYGTSADVPYGIKSWLYLRIGTLYRFREEIQAGTWQDLPNRFVDGLLDPFRVYQ